MTARTPAWRNVLAPSLMVLAAAITLIMAPGPAEAQNAPNFPDLLHAQQEQRSKWDRLGRLIWKNLKQIDLDFVRNGRIVPPGLPGSTVKSPTACGRVARIWIRMPFHDCGTYSTITGDGGCNGSLRKELPSTMPLIDGKGNVIFKDIFDSLGKDKARADVAFDPQRVENTGMAISTSFFFQMKFAAEKWGLTASWADVMVYSGKCGNTSQMRMWYKQSIASAQTEVVHKYQYTCITGYHFVSLSVALCPWYIQGRRACRHLYSNMAWTSVEPCC
eukprot:GHUV01008346.1.p1 GENE.GHUV01008346.1~~GHUV01008346.1.p1  ORF type:complete len:275 (+),score=27.86 GHUV01008346.1:583-1407(+)